MDAYAQTMGVKFASSVSLAPQFRFRLWSAGHILGSSSIELGAGTTRRIFSGDIGPDHKAFHPDPTAPAGFDHVICESTYGDRIREEVSIEERRTLLQAEISGGLVRAGNLVIPVFVVERTQELLLGTAGPINARRHPPPRVSTHSPP